MGAEDFQVGLMSDALDIEHATAYLETFDDISVIRKKTEELFFEYRKGGHVIEVELSRPKLRIATRISCRFSLCHPDSVDEVFADFVVDLAQGLSLPIEILEDVPAGEPYRFLPADLNGFRDALKKSIATKRDYWIKDFGDVKASLTCREAVQRFILKQS